MLKVLFTALAIFLAGFSTPSFAVSMNFNGNFRADTAFYNNPDLGAGNINANRSYLGARALLNPNLLIDDHFSLKSQWSLLASPGFTPAATPLSVGQGGYIFGDASTASLNLSRTWLEWTSDYGVLRVGRMPFSWAHGLLWDAGDEVWDDYQTTMDRLEYRLYLGHLIGGLAFSKGRKNSLLGENNDSSFYSLFIQYENPESDLQGGLLYENQWRSPGQSDELLGLSGTSNPYKTPGAATELSAKTPFPRNNHVVDVYLKKTFGSFSIGGELAWLTGVAADYNGDGKDDTMSAIGSTVRLQYEAHAVRAFLDFTYASGDNDLNDNTMNGFVLLNRNRRPGLILGRELLGPYAGNGNHTGAGSCVVYGNKDSFSGCYYLRPGVKVEWSPSWSSGIEVIIAQKSAVQPGESATLGTEIDIGTDYAVYQNFNLGLNLGYLFAGDGLRKPSPNGVFGLRIMAGLKF